MKLWIIALVVGFFSLTNIVTAEENPSAPTAEHQEGDFHPAPKKTKKAKKAKKAKKTETTTETTTEVAPTPEHPAGEGH